MSNADSPIFMKFIFQIVPLFTRQTNQETNQTKTQRQAVLTIWNTRSYMAGPTIFQLSSRQPPTETYINSSQVLVQISVT